MKTNLTTVIFLLSSIHLFSQTNAGSRPNVSRYPNSGPLSARYEFLKRDLKDAGIVLLGEPSHSPEYYPTKIEIVKYLHEQMGFDVLAFESGLYQMNRVDADIRNGNSIGEAFAKGLFPIWTSTEEFELLYAYLDSLRSTNNTLIIAGFDCQMSGSNASAHFVDDLREAAGKVNMQLDGQALDILQKQIAVMELARSGLSEEFTEESMQQLIRLAARVGTNPELELYHEALSVWIGHFGDLFYNHLYDKIKAGTFGGKDNNVRDSLMALQMVFLYEQLYPGKKIIGWGATAHFAKKFSALEDSPPEAAAFVSMGQRLTEHPRASVFVLGVTTDSNYPGTLEEQLSNENTGLGWIANMSNAHFSSCLLRQPYTGNWEKVVDGILYFKSYNDYASKYFIRGRIINAEDSRPVPFASMSIAGTTLGTSSNGDGNYFLKIDSSQVSGEVDISSIGFKTKKVLLKTLLKNKDVRLVPEIKLLNEVVVTSKALTATDILKLAFDNIPKNYVQQPFNLEFYSMITVTDTIKNQTYSVESIFEDYADGYFKGARKNFRILQKREIGDYFANEKTHGLNQWPVWEVALNDLFGEDPGLQITNVTDLRKIEPKLSGLEMLNGDTVFVVRYNYRNSGTLYISSKDYAILKHVTEGFGKGYKNKTEILYKKQNDKYFPYAANGYYLHRYKIDGKRRTVKITNTVSLNSIQLDHVHVFEHNAELWHPKNVPYNEQWWIDHYGRSNPPVK